jgi:hypothetical protein
MLDEVAVAEGTGVDGVKSSRGNVSLESGGWAQERSRDWIDKKMMAWGRRIYYQMERGVWRNMRTKGALSGLPSGGKSCKVAAMSLCQRNASTCLLADPSSV